MVRTLACLLLSALPAALAAAARDPAQDPAQEPGRPDAFRAPWPPGLQRPWVGPDFFANRLADWRLADGRVECLEARPRFPLRTLHLLTRCASGEPGTLLAAVRLGVIEAGEWGEEALAGILIGAGGDHVDQRLTALVHHLPAPDGGLLACIDGAGRVALRDHSRDTGKGGGWSIDARVSVAEDLPLLEQERRGQGFGAAGPGPVTLLLSAGPGDGGYDLRLTAQRGGEVLSEALARGVDPALVDGGLALVSHRGAGERGFWFADWTVEGSKLETHPERAFGPVICTLYTLHDDVLKLTAQLPPLGIDDPREAVLEVLTGGQWVTVQSAEIVPDSWTATFTVAPWSAERDAPVRVAYELLVAPGQTRRTVYGATVRAEPRGRDELVVAGFTGHKCYTGGLRWNSDGIWFPHADIVSAVRHHDPDLLFFSGDQVYEGDLDVAIRQGSFEDSMLDYLYKWYRWCWAFRDLTRDRPAVCVPDDHDVYHGNIWGAAGVRGEVRSQSRYPADRGGYNMPTRFVNAVHRTQCSHLPQPWESEPLANGVRPYHTVLDYGGLSCAILADRMYKSAPAVLLEAGDCRNGWFHEPGFDPPTQADAPGAELLGPGQEAMLEAWAADWSDGVWTKLVLSQTIFANVATLPAKAASDGVVGGLAIPEAGVYVQGDRPVADADSNGWPRSGRDRALSAMRKGFALHLAGDQHLGSTVQYGVEDWGDAGFALCVPSVGNTFPRRWFPPEPGAHRAPGAARYTGEFRDGFGNRITVHAVSNPARTGRQPARLHDRSPGYGILRFQKATRRVTIECWPRGVDPSRPDARQYPGWPITVDQTQNYGRQPVGWLPPVSVEGMVDPVFQVSEASGEVLYTLRIEGRLFRPFVFAEGPFTVGVGEPGTDRWQRLEGLVPSNSPNVPVIVVDLE